MYVRELNQQEILPALHLVWEVFVENVAPCYTPEGVEEFRRFIRYENIYCMCQTREITMFGAFDEGVLVGTISVKSVGHICLFFVKNSYQGKGIGRMLFQTVQNHCVQKLQVNRITVNAAPNAAPKYIHMGMRQTEKEQFVKGMRYIPMEMYVNPLPARQVRNDNQMFLIIAGGVIAVALFIILIFGGIVAVIWGTSRLSEKPKNWERYQEEWWDDDFFDDDYTRFPQEDEEIGLDSISEQIGEKLSYEIGEDSYVFYDNEKQYTTIDFDVGYPRLTGLGGEVEDTVNQALESCALETVDKVYRNPSEEMKEKILKTEYPILVSYVDYRVCFASEDFLSVAFEDNNCQGDAGDYHQNLRTVNVNLKNGRVYELGEIVDVSDDAFIELWLERIRSDEISSEYFSELNREEIKRTFAGDSLGDVYVVNFFLDKEGINIGYDLNYEKGDSHDIGYSWLMITLGEGEIADYVVEPELWRWLDEPGM